MSFLEVRQTVPELTRTICMLGKIIDSRHLSFVAHLMVNS